MTRRAEQIEAATKHLRRRDPRLRAVIRRVGPCTLRLRRDRFATLVHSIIGQQVSGKAARAILGRVQALAGPEKLSAERLSRCSFDELRGAGLSRQKASYIHDLCDKTASETVRLNRLGRLSDEAVIDELTQVKGIGRWTAEMLLIFSLGRLDVLPCDDLGIRNAIQRLHDLQEPPHRADCLRLAEPWRPYASIASWYCWRSLDL